MNISSPIGPVRLESPSGLSVRVNANGSVQRMDHRDILLNLFLGNEIEGGPTNLYLRRHGDAVESIPLLGPRSPAAVGFDAKSASICGEWEHLRFQVTLVLAEAAAAWLWHVVLENAGADVAAVDLVYAQDIALAHYAAARMNEYYVSQYIDHTPLDHSRCGKVLAIRQNLSMGGRHPWAIVGSLRKGVSFATDALQFHGLSTRASEVAAGLQMPSLPGKRRQHEHSMAVIQDAQQSIPPGGKSYAGFFGWFEEDHPTASSATDLAFVERALALPEASPPPPVAVTNAIVPTLFSTGLKLASQPLGEARLATLFGTQRRNIEYGDDGRLLSFFAGSGRHVVMKEKDLEVLRPHGHLIRSGSRLVPDEASLTSTNWMSGVFHSLVTQGHVNINRLLSTTRSYLGLFRSGGQRVFVELDDGYHLLDMPSAYEMTANGCRWVYDHPAGSLEVRSWAPVDRHELLLSIDILDGSACRFLISHHVAINGDDGAEATALQFTYENGEVLVRPIPDSDVGRRFPQGFFRIAADETTGIERVATDELLFVDGRSRRQPFLTLLTSKTRAVRLRFTGHLIAADDAPQDDVPHDHAADAAAEQRHWDEFLGGLALDHPGTPEEAAGVGRLEEILPWLAHNAMIHYLAPRGLEQYSGGGWGTRDVCQGPVELLLALGHWEPLRDLLLRIYKVQNPDGDWPQWFMFFERERNIRPAESHGDIIFWPLLALAQYLKATEDASILDEVVVFFDQRGDDQAEKATVWGHVERALKVINERVIPGTHLEVYGHGDWNDSLQPVDPALGARLCSAWTVTLHYQMLGALADALDRVSRADEAKRFRAQAAQIVDEFRRRLIVDGTIVGYAHFREDGEIDYLLHPSDETTGIRFSLLPMMHAITNGMLTPEQAEKHLGHIRKHLLAADGARLFDRPFDYRGGPQRYFQRAEGSTFFGREVGIMYMHGHLRYAETMARVGDADALFLALLQANACGLQAVVPQAPRRQSNCYYSSSDALFLDRYEALSTYARVKTGQVAFEGGWRIYSSGAGILVRLIRECLLGIRLGRSALTIDPVMPAALDGLGIGLELAGHAVRISYHLGARGCGPTRLTLNDKELPFQREENPYRLGGVEVSMAELEPRLTEGENTLRAYLQ